jgi:putative SOS response-associated peptidase YedK
MCGRFVLKAPFSELVRLYSLTNNVNLEPRYNIPPTEDIAVVRSDPEGRARRLDMLRRGSRPVGEGHQGRLEEARGCAIERRSPNCGAGSAA